MENSDIKELSEILEQLCVLLNYHPQSIILIRSIDRLAALIERLEGEI